VFWLVNLYSLLLYLEHNGDEPPKEASIIFLTYNILFFIQYFIPQNYQKTSWCLAVSRNWSYTFLCQFQANKVLHNNRLEQSKSQKNCQGTKSISVNWMKEVCTRTPVLLWVFFEGIQKVTKQQNAVQFPTGRHLRRLLSSNTNKMQLCNRIYYSKIGRASCRERVWIFV
jgi:hypothetical protein